MPSFARLVVLNATVEIRFPHSIFVLFLSRPYAIQCTRTRVGQLFYNTVISAQRAM
jgi:hypothetical protein